MTDDATKQNAPESEKLLTAEELQLALDASRELEQIAFTLSELEIATRNESSLYSDSLGAFERQVALYDTRIYRSLVARRGELRELLLDLR